MSDQLRDFIAERVGTPKQVEPEGVTRDRERQEQLRQRGERVALWRNYVNGHEKAERVDGAQLANLTEALGGVGFVSEVLGLRPDDVQRAIDHSATTFLSDNAVRRFISAAQDAMDQANERSEGSA